MKLQLEMSLKAGDIQFTDFQKSILRDRMVDRDGKKGFVRSAMTYRDWSETSGEDKEVKMNMRFLSRLVKGRDWHTAIVTDTNPSL